MRILKSNPAFQTLSMGSLVLMIGLIVFQLLACSGIVNQNSRMTRTELIRANEKSKTFQELGFFGDIKKDQWNDFVLAVQQNITHSRKEPGNLSFSLYRPEDGKRQPIWFERFSDKAAHNHYKEQDYFKKAITVIQKSLVGTPRAIELSEVDEVPAAVPTLTDTLETTRHVIVLFDVKPEKRQSFIDAMAEVVSRSRQAQGNLEYNLYQYAADPDKFVRMEGWESLADYEAQWQTEYTKRLGAVTAGFFVADPMDTRWSLTDISQ